MASLQDSCLNNLIFLSLFSLILITPPLISADLHPNKPKKSDPTAKLLLKPSSSSPMANKTGSPGKKLKSSLFNSNSTSLSGKKASDLITSKNKTAKLTTGKQAKTQTETARQKPDKVQKKQPGWIEDDGDDDLVAGLRDLPSKFQETIVPDLERISKTSQIYLTRYNKEFAKGFKPYFGSRHASTMASLVLLAFILAPLIIVSLVFSKIKPYFSLQRLLVFIQVYLAIYFSILAVSAAATGLEPLRFFYAASRATYVGVQAMQTLAYVLYLLILLMYLILVFSTVTGLATKLLGFGQAVVGFAVGLHYYVTVFHRAVLRQPPRSSWRVHAIYATCFIMICLLGRVDRGKKSYLQEGGEEGKKN